MQVCPTPGCPTSTPGGRCDECRAKANRRRGSSTSKGYGERWKRTRTAYLREHPYCQCPEHLAQPEILRPRATQVDHIDGLGPHGPRGFDWSNLRGLTASCHSRRTAQDQPGGWNDRES